MSINQNDEVSPPLDEGVQVAGFWRRIAAFMVDSIILGIPTLLFGLAFFQWAASLGQTGRLFGFIVGLLYFGVLNSHIGGGRTLGKRLLGIRVVGRNGKELSFVRSVLRYMVFAIPFTLNGFWFELDAETISIVGYIVSALAIIAVFGGLGAIIYLFVFNRRTRQSLHDLAVGSFVIREASPISPINLSTPRLHLIVAGGWLSLVLIGCGVGIWQVNEKIGETTELTPLAELRTAIKNKFDLPQVGINVGNKFSVSLKTDSSETSYLSINVTPAEGHEEYGALRRDIARFVFERCPGLLGYQVLSIQIYVGFDLGLASWSVTYNEAYDVATWREKLGE